MSSFNTYSFKNVSVIWGEEFVDFAEGDDVVNIEPAADFNTKVVGAKGDTLRSQSNDSSAVVTIKLLQTSATHKFLYTTFNLDRESGAGVLPMIIEDKETGQKVVLNNVWIQKLPTMTRGQNANTQDWIFEADFQTVFYI